MNLGLAVLLGIVAVVMTGIAVAAGTNQDEVIPAATVAVAAAAGLLVGVSDYTRWPRGRTIPTLPADPARVRASLGAGVMGRAALISLLDALERSGGNTAAGITPPDEVKRLRSLNSPEFRKYLEVRVSDLEKRT